MGKKAPKPIPELEERLQALESELRQVSVSGAVMRGYWIDETTSRGKTYYRLRWYRGEGQSDGSRAIAPADVPRLREQIARGNQVKKLEKELAEVEAELAKKRQIARELGLLPEIR
jgi:hypothetical protein